MTKPDTTSYGRHAVKGGAWLFLLKTTQRGLGLVRTIILARLLSPNDFGLMGVAVLAINMLETFSKTGFEQALIQKKEDIKSYLDPAWTMQIIRAVVLFLILFFLAPLIARFFKSPQALDIIRVLAFMELFVGAKNIGTVFFQKDLRFGKKVMLEFSGLVPNMIISISMALVLKNVWALVYGSLAGALCMAIASYFIHPYKPSFRFDAALMKEMFRFGKWLFGSSILIFLVTQGDDAFVGRMLGITALGLYQMAYHISNSFTTEITHVVSEVMFPAYSKLQHDLKRLAAAYMEVFKVNMFFAFLVFAGIMVFAGDFTRVVLGAKWAPIIPLLRILAVAGLFRSLASTTSIVFHSLGKPKLDTVWQSVRLAVLVVLIFPLALRWGIPGVAIAACVSILTATVGFISSLLKELPLSGRHIIRDIFWPGLSAFCMALVILPLKSVVGEPALLSFIAMAIAAVVLYFVFSAVWGKIFGYGIYELIQKRMKEVV